MKKVLVIKGYSKNNALVAAADEIILGFQSKGYEVEVIDTELDTTKQLLRELSKPCSFFFSCQAIGFEALLDYGQSVFTQIKTPYIGWIFDDIAYHLNRIENVKFGHTYLYCIDRQHVKYIKQMYPDTTNIMYLMHGGFENQEKNDLREQEKDIDILFPGNIWNKPVLDKMIEEPEPIEIFLIEQAIQLLKELPYLSVREALEQVLNRHNEILTSQLLHELTRVIYYLDNYMRYVCKYHVLEALLAGGLKVHVAGEGTKELEEKYPGQIIALGGKDIHETNKLFGRAKIVVNPISTYTEGIHDRVFTAMLHKAIAFTPYGPYAGEILGSRVGYFYMNHLPQMANDIKTVLDNYQIYQEKLLDDNYTYALEHHTWKKRGEEIVEFYEKNIRK